MRHDINEEQPESGAASVFVVVEKLYTYRVLLLGLSIFGGGLGLIWALWLGPAYVSRSSFAVMGSSEATQLQGLASQFGVSLGSAGGAGGESPMYYATTLKSRRVLSAVARHGYTAPDGGTKPLHELWHVGVETESEQILETVESLREAITVSVDFDAAVISVSVEADSPRMAESINRQLLDEVMALSVANRQSRAREEREFVEKRKRETEAELVAAERALKNFLERNRSYQSSPELAFEADRLERMVSLRQQLYVTLSQWSDEARLRALKESPSAVIIDPPEASAEKVGNVAVASLLGVVIGLIPALMAVAVIEYFRFARRIYPRHYANLIKTMRG